MGWGIEGDDYKRGPCGNRIVILCLDCGVGTWANIGDQITKTRFTQMSTMKTERLNKVVGLYLFQCSAGGIALWFCLCYRLGKLGKRYMRSLSFLILHPNWQWPQNKVLFFIHKTFFTKTEFLRITSLECPFLKELLGFCSSRLKNSNYAKILGSWSLSLLR